ncbi:methyltransferase [Stenotrophomonas chelatiphaga]|uniref:Methyltransferase n=1 Tax=Stenotrophomonas chelatiphaga TaxID=517011 RepID=A0A0R0DH15_9GAMM|nr:class I SAM-dependent methyltransferase [Stenotrophomonas chelatiphaga]KRG76739.1 methyltransferase [Stenotrophomonas chelatiphaga]MCS4230771.1 putative methyltransferase [Stenotrophomonas chelatiphaga]ROQ40265.1 putative methyltransferase [Stenotrophomonas maltophilia]
MKNLINVSACCLAVAVALSASPLYARTPAAAGAASPVQVSPAIEAAVKSTTRDPANVTRDGFRHPAQTLSFFKLTPASTVIEITPGNGWYSEILAPLVRQQGQYIAAVVDPAAVPEGRGRDYQQRSRDGLQKKFSTAPAQFDKATEVAYDPAAPVFGKPASADVVLTFRNVHNWRKSGQAPGMFKGFYDVLKPGGVLGVVEHRAKADVGDDDGTGYVGQQQVIAMAEAAGFKLDGSSEINANPRDTKDHPNGVWTLPPSNNHDAADAAKYRAIGESDRMTLRFIKPRS